MTGKANIYLDYCATTPCAKEVVKAMLPFFTEDFGNPSSPHTMGKQASAAVEAAREQISLLAGCLPEEIVFTSGATESNNIVLLGIAVREPSRKKILISSIEHKSVLEPTELLSEQGFIVTHLPVGDDLAKMAD